MSSDTQSIKIDFRLLENTEFNRLMRSGCFNTYCQIRKMIWRSLRPSVIGDLHIRYMSGSLAAACKTKKLAQLCSVTPRQVRNDIRKMKEEYQIVDCVSENDYYVFILGEWNEIERNGKPLRYEYYYLDKYATFIQRQSEDEEMNFPSEEKDFHEVRKFISPKEYITRFIHEKTN